MLMAVLQARSLAPDCTTLASGDALASSRRVHGRRDPVRLLKLSSDTQSVIGGVAHLLNFDGSDTMSAAYYAQFTLNGGRPVAQSIPASEHRCAWRNGSVVQCSLPAFP